MLSEREKCGSEGVPLLAPFALKNIPAAASGVPPAIAERAPVKQAHEREQLGCHLPEFAEEGSPRHAVVGAATFCCFGCGRCVSPLENHVGCHDPMQQFSLYLAVAVASVVLAEHVLNAAAMAVAVSFFLHAPYGRK